MTRAVRGLSIYWLVQLACWGGYAGISVLALLPSTPLERVPRLLLIKGVRGVLGLPLSHLLYLVYRRLIRRGVGPLPLSFAALAGSALLSPIWLLLSVHLLAFLDPVGSTIAWRDLPHRSLDLAIALVGWSAAYFGWRHWRVAEAAERDAHAARDLATRAQLEALRYQLNPHFLFNALASVRGCILEDPGRAREMITQLSEVLRYALRSGSAPLVPLTNELEVIRDYLAIERARFQNAIETRIEVSPEAAAVRVPPFLVHSLVENAVTHGRRTTQGVLQIQVRGEVAGAELRLSVANTGTLRPGRTPFQDGEGSGSGGIGLENVRQRLAHVFGGAATLELAEADGWVSATLRIGLAPPASSASRGVAHGARA